MDVASGSSALPTTTSPPCVKKWGGSRSAASSPWAKSALWAGTTSSTATRPASLCSAKTSEKEVHHETPLALVPRCAGHRGVRCGDWTGVGFQRQAAQRAGSEVRIEQSAQLTREGLLPGRRADRRRARHRGDPRHRREY